MNSFTIDRRPSLVPLPPKGGHPRAIKTAGPYHAIQSGEPQRTSSVKGFTLLELLVGMIVSGIVLGAAFTAYHIVSKQAFVYQEKTKVNEELSLLHSRLMEDFHEAEIILPQSESALLFICHFERHPELVEGREAANIEYLFTTNSVLRKNGEHTDTFFVNITECKTFFKGEPITDPALAADEVRLLVKVGAQKEEIILKKMSDAKTKLHEQEL